MIVAAVLAAGASMRLGRPKQLIALDGEPLVRRAARLARASSCTEVAVVLGAHADAIAPTLDGLGVEVLENPLWPEGMGSSVRAAVGWALAECAQALLLVVCDQPRLTTAHLDALIAHRGRVGSSYLGVVGVPALFPAVDFPALAMVRGDRGARTLLAGAASIDWPDGAIDVDTDDDLAKLTDRSRGS